MVLFPADNVESLKRFGLEGLESVIAGLESYVNRSAEHGVKDITLGMPHRGRLNVLANVLKKPFVNIFAEIKGKKTNENDLIYHLGTYNEREYPDGTRMILVILKFII